jgi:hypothetical protein
MSVTSRTSDSFHLSAFGQTKLSDITWKAGPFGTY